MSKKNFKTSFDSLLGEGESESKSKKRTPIIEEVRATFLVKVINQEKLKAVSYWERKMMKEILDEALTNYFDSYEASKGKIKLPEKLS